MRFENGDLLGRTNLHEFNEGTGGAGVLQNAPTFTQNFTPKNYTYPSREGVMN